MSRLSSRIAALEAALTPIFLMYVGNGADDAKRTY